LKELAGASTWQRYFEEQENAQLFTVAASSIISTEWMLPSQDARIKTALQISKASRITTEGGLNIT